MPKTGTTSKTTSASKTNTTPRTDVTYPRQVGIQVLKSTGSLDSAPYDGRLCEQAASRRLLSASFDRSTPMEPSSQPDWIPLTDWMVERSSRIRVPLPLSSHINLCIRQFLANPITRICNVSDLCRIREHGSFSSSEDRMVR